MKIRNPLGTVVRVKHGRDLYSYRTRARDDVKVGDLVDVTLPTGRTVTRAVRGTGRAKYWGALKPATLALREENALLTLDAQALLDEVVELTQRATGNPVQVRASDSTWQLVGGLRLTGVHAEDAGCAEACCIHNPSDHPLRHAPQHWRADRELMERTCEHGVGHPDPDHLAYVKRAYGEAAAWTESVHGCDGCCTGQGPT